VDHFPPILGGAPLFESDRRLSVFSPPFVGNSCPCFFYCISRPCPSLFLVGFWIPDIFSEKAHCLPLSSFFCGRPLPFFNQSLHKMPLLPGSRFYRYFRKRLFPPSLPRTYPSPFDFHLDLSPPFFCMHSPSRWIFPFFFPFGEESPGTGGLPLPFFRGHCPAVFFWKSFYCLSPLFPARSFATAGLESLLFSEPKVKARDHPFFPSCLAVDLSSPSVRVDRWSCFCSRPGIVALLSICSEFYESDSL